MSDNWQLAQHFREIAQGYYSIADKWRKRAYDRAADTISNFPEKITSSRQLENVRGFGASTLSDVEEFLQKGSTERHRQLYMNASRQDDLHRETINLFQSVYGIGPQNAEYFYGLGYRDLQSLYQSGLLNDKQMIGLQYRDDLLQKIPRAEIEYFGYQLNSRIPNENIFYFRDSTGNNIQQIESIWHIAGSYRRGENESGDIDLLARYIDMDTILNTLQDMGMIVATLAYGETKYMGIIKVAPNAIARRLDIRIFRPTDYVYGLLYFTGSQKFNILMRNRANELGATLNEYGLTDAYGGMYPVNREEEIFRILGIIYYPPEQRFRDISFLQYTTPTIRQGASIVEQRKYFV